MTQNILKEKLDFNSTQEFEFIIIFVVKIIKKNFIDVNIIIMDYDIIISIIIIKTT